MVKFYSSNPRSKVKGTLELYHAYITDILSSTNESDENDSQNDSGGWELLDQPSPTSNHTPEDQAEVNTCFNSRLTEVALKKTLYERFYTVVVNPGLT